MDDILGQIIGKGRAQFRWFGWWEAVKADLGVNGTPETPERTNMLHASCQSRAFSRLHQQYARIVR